jgi:uncharacterized protein (DUF1800 family)
MAGSFNLPDNGGHRKDARFQASSSKKDTLMTTRHPTVGFALLVLLFAPFACLAATNWTGDLAPIGQEDWNTERAAHLLERAGFGGTPEDIANFAAMTPEAAVKTLVYHKNIPNELPAFDDSGAHDPGLEPFPASRPAATDLAKETGESMGIRVKPTGNRRLQPVANKFFYWLRASRLETNRVAYWWANRMLATNRPLEEKMALFWHGHFATSEEKVRDYRKMLKQNELFRARGTGNFRDLLISVAQDPAMLAFLDAGVNVKGAPNENFAREIMEMFSMGVGNYSETDIREAARAFTGWNFVDLEFVITPEKHDATTKTFFGKQGSFDGVDVIDVILSQPVTSEYVAAKIYRYFARQELSPELRADLGARLRESNYEIAPLLETIFLSKDFYAPPSMATHIKSPVELVISTYKKLGLTEVPGVPDFNDLTEALGQKLLYPPIRHAVSRHQFPAARSLSAYGLQDRRREREAGTGPGCDQRYQARSQGSDFDVDAGGSRRGFQYASRELPRLADGSAESEADPARNRASRPVGDGAGCGLQDSARGHRLPAGPFRVGAPGREHA